MASTRDWFETVAEAQRRARRRLPRSVYLAVLAGAEAGVTMNDNVKAFSELWFRPHVAGLPAAAQPIRQAYAYGCGKFVIRKARTRL